MFRYHDRLRLLPDAITYAFFIGLLTLHGFIYRTAFTPAISPLPRLISYATSFSVTATISPTIAYYFIFLH